MKPTWPTVMPSDQSTANRAPHPKALPTSLPTQRLAADAAISSKNDPKRLDGVVRHGLHLSVEHIRSHFPTLSANEAIQIQQLLNATVLETLTRRQATDWGLALQRRYGEVVETTLQLNQSPLRLAAQQHLQRLLDLLQDVFDALAGQLQPRLLSRWRTSPWKILQKHQAEINVLRQALADAAEGLASQRDVLLALQQDLVTLTEQLLTNALGASLLARQLSDDLAGALLQRAAQLQQMHGHVSDAVLQRGQSLADIQTLNSAIQHAVLVLLPAWLDKALHTSRSNTHPTLILQQQQDLGVLLHTIRSA